MMVEKLAKDLDLKSSVLKEIMKNEMREEMEGAFEKNTFVNSGFDQQEMDDLAIWQKIRQEDNESDESSSGESNGPTRVNYIEQL